MRSFIDGRARAAQAEKRLGVSCVSERSGVRGTLCRADGGGGGSVECLCPAPCPHNPLAFDFSPSRAS